MFGGLESLPGQAVEDGWVTVTPREFQGAINNPLKGFRDYKRDGFGLIRRQYVRWNDIEISADDSVDRIIAYTNRVTTISGRRFEDLNVKLVPRVYLDWDSSEGRQYWPADLHMFDYDSPAFQERLRKLVEKLGQAWDNDPRIFAIQMGLIGKWGEHHSPAPTVAQRRRLTGIFQQAFRNKPVLVRHTNAEFMAGGFGIYYDTFATLEREPPQGPRSQFPMAATEAYPDIWKRNAIEGEVEYNWQRDRASAKPLETFGLTPNETMTVPAYLRYMLDKIRKYHASYLGWISDYTDTNPDVLAGAGELQKAFGYRFVLDEARYPATVAPGGNLALKLTVRNTGSAPFYLDWPVGVALLDPATRKPVWAAPVEGVDIRQWMPGEDWDSDQFVYRRPAAPHQGEGMATLPADIAPGAYILAVTILDRQGGLTPSARFAMENYIRGGWQPLGFIGVGGPPPDVALSNIQFDSPAFDDSLRYQVPAALRSVAVPPPPPVTPVTRWMPDPGVELINPWRFWSLRTPNDDLEKDTILDGPGGVRGIRVTGDYQNDSSLEYHFGAAGKLAHGSYQFTFHTRGTAGQFVEFELGDDWRVVSREARFPLSEQWQEHTLLFEAKPTTRDVTTLRFRLTRNTKGTFDLSNMRLKMLR